MVKCKKYVLAKHFDGAPKDSDIQLVEEDLPDIKDGEFLCEAVYLSVDPYMRPYSKLMMKEGDGMFGHQIARVLESKNTEHPVGTNVLTLNGWRSHFISTGEGVQKLDLPSGVPLEQGLGVLGMVGMTAYFGFLDICQPKEGETLVVNGAAGAVGSMVGQLGKIKGCRVIGYAGSDEKVKRLKTLGFDEAFNYKKVDLDESLKKSAPNGVDLYFDNVGGQFTVTVRNHLNKYARVSHCGAISMYNKTEPEMVPCHDMMMVGKEIKAQGFNVMTYMSRYPEGIKQMGQWYSQGKIKCDIHMYNGFENMKKAFFGLFTGENVGKALVKYNK